MVDPLQITLEFARLEAVGDPHAEVYGAQDYLVRLGGGGYRQATLGWKSGFKALLGRVRRPGCDPADVAALGETLRAFLDVADWSATETAILDAVSAQRPVVITVVSAAAELYRLPLELTRLRVCGQRLGELPGVLLRHAWPEVVPVPEAPAPRIVPERVVLAWSAAGGRVPEGPHLRALEAACGAAHLGFRRDRDVVPRASLEAIVAELARPGAPPVSVLHLLAHGGGPGRSPGLLLDDGAGGLALVDPAALRGALAPFLGSLRLVVLAACNSGHDGDEDSVLGSIAQALHRAGAAAVVGARFPLSVHGSTVLTEQLYGALLGEPSSLEQALCRARAALRAACAGLDHAAVVFYAPPALGTDSRPVVFRPYQGLLAFSPDQARFFFGRDAERQEIAADLAALADAGRPRFLVVAGASGTGKSSVVMAGAVPDLTAPPAAAAPAEDADLRQLVARVGALVDRYNAPTVREAADRLRAFAAQLDERVETDWARFCPGAAPLAALERALAQDREPGRAFLLVVDQFEEIFTHVDDPGLRERFCQRLWALAGGETGVSVICTVRVDFLGECGQIVLDESGLRLDTVAYDEAHRVFVAQLRPRQLRQCIEAPARAVGLRLEDGLARTLVDELKAEPGALPLLSHVMDQLWLHRTADGRLTLDAYHALGGVGGCLGREADGVVSQLDGAGLRQLRRLMPRLVSAGTDGGRHTRRRMPLGELVPADPAEAAVFGEVVELLVAQRLVVRGEVGGQTTVEVAHEALIRHWSTLHEWLAESDELLDALATLQSYLEAWREHRSVLTGEQLVFAGAFARRHPDEVGEELAGLIRLSEEEAQASRSSWFFVLLVFLGGFVSLCMGAWDWQLSLVEALWIDS